MKTIFVVPLFITLFLLLSSDLCAQAIWTKHSGNPVIPGAAPFTSLLTPCVLYNTDSLRYEMWFAASTSSSADRPFRIGFAVSTDGIGWTVHPSPVLAPTAGMWDSFTVEAPYVIRENGQYKMWYWGALRSPGPGSDTQRRLMASPGRNTLGIRSSAPGRQRGKRPG